MWLGSIIIDLKQNENIEETEIDVLLLPHPPPLLMIYGWLDLFISLISEKLRKERTALEFKLEGELKLGLNNSQRLYIVLDHSRDYKF